LREIGIGEICLAEVCADQTGLYEARAVKVSMLKLRRHHQFFHRPRLMPMAFLFRLWGNEDRILNSDDAVFQRRPAAKRRLIQAGVFEIGSRISRETILRQVRPRIRRRETYRR